MIVMEILLIALGKGGNSQEDNLVFDADSSNDCTADCNGDFGGSAVQMNVEFVMVLVIMINVEHVMMILQMTVCKIVLVYGVVAAEFDVCGVCDGDDSSLF